MLPDIHRSEALLSQYAFGPKSLTDPAEMLPYSGVCMTLWALLSPTAPVPPTP
ncbi:hypothetical protein [Streptomyces sp. NPDC056682]|uniref:hypothetical protein n=1 Tax=Streptomyces sp. NPDC056682 TaxID=3345909 RepID=UPI0036A82282